MLIINELLKHKGFKEAEREGGEGEREREREREISD